MCRSLSALSSLHSLQIAAPPHSVILDKHFYWSLMTLITLNCNEATACEKNVCWNGVV